MIFSKLSHKRAAARCVARCAAVLLLLALALPARAAEWEHAAPVGGEGRDFAGEIIIGASLPFTGIFEYYGQSAYYGAVERVRMANDSGGVNGKRLSVVWRDNRSSPTLATEQVRDFALDPNIPAVIGPLLSDSASAVSELSKQYEFVSISPMATTNAVVGNSEWLFRATFNNTAEAEALVRFQMEHNKTKTVAVLYDSAHEFSTELADIFAKRFAENGGAVTVSLPIAKGEDGDEDHMTAPLRQIAATNPDFIFAPLYALEAVEMMAALKRLGIDIPVCGSDTWDNELVFDASGRRLVGTAFASPVMERSADYEPFQTFYKAMERAGMENPDAQAAYAWDSVSMLLEAFKTGETSEALRDGLSKIQNIPLATGNLTILPNHESRKPVFIRAIEERDNRLLPVFIERFDPAAPASQNAASAGTYQTQ